MLTPRTGPTCSASRRAVVRQAELYVRARLDTRVSLTRLCRAVGVSERGLRNAFYGVHGMCPRQWMLNERLHNVRRALADAGARPATVTDVATLHGFYELGRFAATYKQAFGEAPSETLRAAARGLVAGSPSHNRNEVDHVGRS
jgi:transcriptional regulator GlxA family with amidase domain